MKRLSYQRAKEIIDNGGALYVDIIYDKAVITDKEYGYNGIYHTTVYGYVTYDAVNKLIRDYHHYNGYMCYYVVNDKYERLCRYRDLVKYRFKYLIDREFH